MPEVAIEWAETTRGARMPFNGPILAAHTQPTLTGREIHYIDTALTPTHFQTCPQADGWRARGAR